MNGGEDSGEWSPLWVYTMVCNKFTIDNGESNVNDANTEEQLCREWCKGRLTLRDWVTIECHPVKLHVVYLPLGLTVVRGTHVSCVPGSTSADKGRLSGNSAKKELIGRFRSISTLW